MENGNVIVIGDIFMSPSIDKLSAALAKAQGQMGFAAKDSVNPHFKSKYADLASLWDASREPLTANGLSVIQLPHGDSDKVKLGYLLAHASGQFIGSTGLGLTPQQKTPQAVGSCITYGRRYTQAGLTGMTQDDDDGNAASGKHVATPAPAPGKPNAVEPPRKVDPIEVPFGSAAEEIYTAMDHQKIYVKKAAAKHGVTHTVTLQRMSREIADMGGILVNHIDAAVAEWLESHPEVKQ